MSNHNAIGKARVEVPTSKALLELSWRLFQGNRITAQYIRNTYHVSNATANRYIQELARALPIHRGWIDNENDRPVLELSMRGKT